jgi:hypothetical protein
VCSWLALAMRLLLGGVPYAGTRLRTAAHSESALRERLRRRQETEGDPGTPRLVDAGAQSPEARNPLNL